MRRCKSHSDKKGYLQKRTIMKKQKMQLGKKVFLNKETVVALHNEEQQNALGGAALTVITSSCYNTCVATCGTNDQYSCGQWCQITDPSKQLC
jgi:hypothetical protein